jgi:hypothetical protein
MTATVVALVAARAEFDAGTLNEADFKDKVNNILRQASSSVSDKAKIAAFDNLSKFIADNYALNEIDNGKQYIKSDLDHYFFEAAFQAVLGPKIWDFYNVTYEAG